MEKGEECATLVLTSDVAEELAVLFVGGEPSQEALERGFQFANLHTQSMGRDPATVALVAQLEASPFENRVA